MRRGWHNRSTVSDPPIPPHGAVNARLLGLLGDTSELQHIEDFRLTLLDALRRAVPADWVALNDIGPDPDTIAVIIDPPGDPKLLSLFTQLADQNPLIERYNATHDGRTLRISDVISREEFHAREIYQKVYRPMGLEHQLAFTLPHVKDRILGVVLARRHDDFTDDERDLIETARPFLIQAYRNAIQYSEPRGRGVKPAGAARPPLEHLRALGLTRRQAQVLQQIAAGAAARDVAVELAISERTVQKHLQLCYRTLNVQSRSQAAALAWSSVDDNEPAAS